MKNMVAETEELKWDAYEKLLGQTEGEGYRFHENIGELVDTLQRYQDTYPDNVNDKVMRWHNDIGYLTGSTLSNLRRYIDGRIDLETFNEFMRTTLDNISITPDSILLAVEESQSLQETIHHTMFVLEMLKKQPPTLLYDCKKKSMEQIREEEKTGKRKTMSEVIGKQLGQLQKEAQREEERVMRELEEEAERDRREFRKDYRKELTLTPQPTAEEIEKERERTIWRRENKRNYGSLEPKGYSIPDAMDYIMTFLSRVDTPAPVKSLKGDMIVKGFSEDEIESAIDNLIMDGDVRVGDMAYLGEVIAPYREPREPRRRPKREVKEVEFEELPQRQRPLPLPEAKGITIGDIFLREIDENTYEFETSRGRYIVRDLGDFGYKLERIA